MQLQASCKKLSYWVKRSSWPMLHRLLSLAFMESLTIYGLVIALVPAPAVLKTSSSESHARCLPRCSSSPTPSSSEQDVSDEVLQLRVGRCVRGGGRERALGEMARPIRRNLISKAPDESRLQDSLVIKGDSGRNLVREMIGNSTDAVIILYKLQTFLKIQHVLTIAPTHTKIFDKQIRSSTSRSLLIIENKHVGRYLYLGRQKVFKDSFARRFNKWF